MRKNLSETVSRIMQNGVSGEMSGEELIHMLLEKTVSEQKAEKTSFGQKLADLLAKVAGSWTFILSFIFVLTIWIGLNVLIAARAFDPYPFILLNLALSCLAAIQAPVIMMSQNRQDLKDRAHSKSAYRVNLKSEIILEDLHYKIDEIIKKQEEILKNLTDLGR